VIARLKLPDGVNAYLAACYAITDQMDQATRHVAETLRQVPDFSVVRFLAKEPFK
jgi:adenylate cyclase